jgi:hypothetical protein
MAKIARTLVSKEYLEMVLRGDVFARPNTTIETDAPKDLEVLGLAYRPHSIGLEIWVKSETFEDVLEGGEPPVVGPFVYTVKELNG